MECIQFNYLTFCTIDSFCTTNIKLHTTKNRNVSNSSNYNVNVNLKIGFNCQSIYYNTVLPDVYMNIGIHFDIYFWASIRFYAFCVTKIMVYSLLKKKHKCIRYVRIVLYHVSFYTKRIIMCIIVGILFLEQIIPTSYYFEYLPRYLVNKSK